MEGIWASAPYATSRCLEPKRLRMMMVMMMMITDRMPPLLSVRAHRVQWTSVEELEGLLVAEQVEVAAGAALAGFVGRFGCLAAAVEREESLAVAATLAGVGEVAELEAPLESVSGACCRAAEAACKKPGCCVEVMSASK